MQATCLSPNYQQFTYETGVQFAKTKQPHTIVKSSGAANLECYFFSTLAVLCKEFLLAELCRKFTNEATFNALSVSDAVCVKTNTATFRVASTCGYGTRNFRQFMHLRY